MPENTNRTKNQLAETIQSNQTEIISALEQLKESDEDHAEFYDGLRERQAAIIKDLEAMMSEEKTK